MLALVLDVGSQHGGLALKFRLGSGLRGLVELRYY